jgi:chemotaxis regulatin CheY-phosphate phosphatase CheZ
MCKWQMAKNLFSSPVAVSKIRLVSSDNQVDVLLSSLGGGNEKAVNL